MKKIFFALGIALVVMNIYNVLNAAYICISVAFVVAGYFVTRELDDDSRR